MSVATTDPEDPIRSVIIQNRFDALVDEAGRIIGRISGSPVASQFHDMTTALLDADGDVVCPGMFLIFHTTGISAVTKTVLREYQENPGIRPGDMFICNNPYDGSPHQSEVILVAPIHHQGRLVAWAGTSIHQADVGGPVPGQIALGAQDIFQEEIPMPALKIIEGGTLRRDLEREYLIRSRTPDLLQIDFRAKRAANRTIVMRFGELIEEYGADAVLGSMGELEDLAESRFRDRLRELPNGVFRHRTYMDYEDEIYRCVLTMTKRADELEFDFEADDQAPAVMNCVRALTEGCVMNSVLTTLCFGGVPWCPAGVTRALRIRTRPGTIIDASWPAGTSGGSSGASVLVTSAADTCLAKLLDASPEHTEFVKAASGGGVGIVDMAGQDQYGRPFLMPILDGCFGTGMGARDGRDGMHSCGPTSAIDSLIANVENMEEQFPVLYLARRHVCDGSGAGEYIGGTSIAPLWMPHDVERIDDVITHGFGVAPESFGLSGGYPGSHFQVAIARDSDVLDQLARGDLPTELSEIEGELEITGSMHRAPMGSRDVYWTIAASPGGGYGDPIDREPSRVRDDVVDCVVSAEGARLAYGVALSRDASGRYQVDDEGTRRERDAIRTARGNESRSPAVVAGNDAFPNHEACAPRRMTSALSVVEWGERAAILCRCGEVLGPTGPGYKKLSLLRESPVRRAGLTTDRFGLASKFVLREFFCPGCQTSLATEVALREDPILTDVELVRDAS